MGETADRTNQYRVAQQNKLNLKLKKEQLQQTQFIRAIQQQFLSRIFGEDGETGPGILSVFEQRQGFRPIGETQQAALARAQSRAPEQIARQFQERGLFGSGAELAAQRESFFDFEFQRAAAREQSEQQRLLQEIGLTQSFLGQAGQQAASIRPGQVTSGLPQVGGGGSPLAALGGQLFGTALGAFLGPAGAKVGGAAGGALAGALFGGGGGNSGGGFQLNPGDIVL